MTPAIQTEALTKTYGPKRALDGLDLTVEPGSVFGFLGGNGAGKTTTIRILLGLARPDSGSVEILGGPPGSATVKDRIGYCPDVPGFLPWMTAPDVMEYSARLFSLDAATTRARTGELLELVGLGGVTSKVGGYSRGMRQRLGLAQALVNAPQLLVLDEPTSALDPMGRRDVLELLQALRGKTTVFFSTHLLPDVERVCDQIAIIDHGRLVAAGPLAQVRSNMGGLHSRILIEVDDAARLRTALTGSPWLLTHDDGETPGALVLTVSDLDAAALALPSVVADQGLRLNRLEPQAPSLEDVFVDLVGSPTAERAT
ncbi:MAG: ABC transporter ATP-binding protein [Promicromonosporaceae bacterium]|nr:ABC transporter ATP-binding protein [Promicromonosporaceae bacterium]